MIYNGKEIPMLITERQAYIRSLPKPPDDAVDAEYWREQQYLLEHLDEIVSAKIFGH
jgi:hypothetical protein